MPSPPLSPLRFALAFVPFVVVTLLHLASLIFALGIDGPTRALLMPTLAIPVLRAIWRYGPQPKTLVLLAALVLSWLGDMTLPTWLLVGLVCFLLAHVAFLVALVPLATHRLPILVALLAVAIVWWLALLVFLAPSLGGLVVPVAIYGIVLGAMAVAAARVSVVGAIGGAAFIASDSILALRMFVPAFNSVWADVAVMALYCLAQLLLVITVLTHDP
jgi:uncharacterized membrane protein YhhN